MRNREDNVIVKKSFEFALDIVDLYNELMELKHWDIARQVLRSGTSIGANIREAQRAESKRDFIHKLSISLKEADETHYWFEIIDAKITKIDSNFKLKIQELLKLLISIINSAKKTSLVTNNIN